jgi:GT2 family glycosyltransferase
MSKEYSLLNKLLHRDSSFPLISVIIPSRIGEDIRTLSSLKRQEYKNLEVIVEYDKFSEGVSVVRNRGAKKAKGEFLFFCDNDIDLEPNAILDLYKCLKSNSSYDWAFGKFFIDNHEYNKDKLETPPESTIQNYVDYFYGISTMSLIRASAKPLFDEKFMRFVDWDLWIRLDKEGHKGKFCNTILFRTVTSPTGISGKGRKHHDYWRDKIYKKHGVKIKPDKLADIIIPHHDKHEFLEKLLKRIPNNLFNIIITSGGSFAENCNKGAKAALTDKLIFLNDDTEPTLEALMELATKDADMVGCSQTIPKFRHLQGVIFYGIGYTLRDNGELEPGLARSLEDAHIPSGFCFSIKREIFEKLNGFDEMYINGAEDQDLGFKVLEAGYKIAFTENPIVHYEAQSDGRHECSGFNQELFHKVWYKERKLKLLNIIPKPMTIKSTTGVQIAQPDEQSNDTSQKESLGIKLELGGKAPVFALGDYRHLDIQQFPHTEYTADAFTSLPLESNSVASLFAKRTIQRLNKKDASLALKEWFRVLAPTGEIKLVTVDIKKAMGKYLQTFETKYLDLLFGTQADKTEFYLNGYSPDVLKNMLEDAGFVNIREIMPTVDYFNSQVEFILTATKPKK